ncbi:MAG: hypothetical protein WC876_03770 [Candidatus Thermoplasmatota archaeon]|jgi:hypothetical protein
MSVKGRIVRLTLNSFTLVIASALLAYLRIEGHIHWPWWLILLPALVVVAWSAMLLLVILTAFGFMVLLIGLRRLS